MSRVRPPVSRLGVARGPLARGLEYACLFEDGGGLEFRDLSPNRLPLESANVTVADWTDGAWGRGIDFASSTGRVQTVQAFDRITGAVGRTSIYLCEVPSSNRYFGGWGTAATGGSWMLRHQSGKMRIEVTSGNALTASGVLTVGELRHLAFTCEGNTDNARFYRDGVEFARDSGSSRDLNTTGTVQLNTGGRPTDDTSAADRPIYGAWHWSRVLSPSEIAEHYRDPWAMHRLSRRRRARRVVVSGGTTPTPYYGLFRRRSVA